MHNSNNISTSQTSGRGRWFSYRACKNQRRNEPPTSSSGSALINGSAFGTLSASGPCVRQFPHPPSASTATYLSQNPQRVANMGCQVYIQRQSQRGRSHNSRQTSRRSKQNLRRSREAAGSSVDEENAARYSSMEVDGVGYSQSFTPPSLLGLAVRGSSIEESDLPGFSYDPSTRRYYRIQPDASGSAIGFRRSDFLRARREQEHLSQLNASHISNSLPHSALRAVMKSLASTLRAREFGYRQSSMLSQLQHGLAESALVCANSTPSYTREVLPNHVDRLAGCQFLDVSKDGKTILGCWAVSNWGLPGDSRRTSSRIMCLSVKSDTDIVRRNGLFRDGGKCCSANEAGNRYGLKFEATSNSIYVLDPNLVDMVTAPVDSDVTCVLYVTASSHLSMQRKLTTCCRVFIEPVPELSNEEDADEMSSPIYNIRWTCQDEVWSCAWNANKMRIGLGMEENAMIVDVVSEQNFRISSRKKNVLSQQFSQDGELLYMGLRGADMVCSDLRLKSHHIVSTFEQCSSVGWIRILRSQPNLLLSENFCGELKMWDIRARKTLMSFKGHKNSHYRLPCFVDDNEKFVFAVGEDGTSRGWSLRSGDLLCAVPSPRPIEQRTDFPRLVYSENWAGRAGNSAIVIAVEGDIRVHELTL
uniref:WD repeat-containing protein n=1 Tax=Ascaris suum TaxID=6253 RepID=F1KW35_ASCSU